MAERYFEIQLQKQMSEESKSLFFFLSILIKTTLYLKTILKKCLINMYDAT